MNKNTSIIKTIADIGIFSALGFVFDEFQSIFFKGIFVNGGSIGIAMIAVIIVGIRRGIIPALVTGLIMGLLDVATGPYVLSIPQVLLDYIFPYFFASFGIILLPFYRKSKDDKHKMFILCIMILLAGMFKLMSHYLAGILYWADPSGFAWELSNINPYLYCFIYNIAFIGPSIVLCQLLIVVLFKRTPSLLATQNNNTIRIEKMKKIETAYFITLLAIGLYLLVFFTVNYTYSHYSEYDGWGTDVSFNANYLVGALTGLLIVIAAISSIIKEIKGYKDVNRLTMYQIVVISIINIVFALASIIRASKKESSFEFNRIEILLAFIVGFIAIYLYTFYFKKRETSKISKQ